MAANVSPLSPSTMCPQPCSQSMAEPPESHRSLKGIGGYQLGGSSDCIEDCRRLTTWAIWTSRTLATAETTDLVTGFWKRRIEGLDTSGKAASHTSVVSPFTKQYTPTLLIIKSTRIPSWSRALELGVDRRSPHLNRPSSVGTHPTLASWGPSC